MADQSLMNLAVEIQQKATRKAILDARFRADGGEPLSEREVRDSAFGRAIEQHFSDIPELYRPFADMPHPASFDSAIRQLKTTLQRLSTGGGGSQDPINHDIYLANPDLDRMKAVERSLNNWTGDAARAFQEGYADTFSTIANNNFILVAVLKSALEAQQNVWAKAWDDVRTVATKANEALDNMDDCGKNEWTVGFTVLAAVAAVGGAALAPFTAGGSVAITAVGSAAVVSSVLPPMPDNTYGGESPQTVILSMRRALADLTQYIQGQENAISRALAAARGEVVGNPTLLVPTPPALADATPETIKGHMGRHY